ncbi:dihydrolipoyl dehydrogenase [Candidatus Protofrankia californiensis]|uniref:Dihydrolipoyl dehydrogenase n=1 Tax=Candidatus Protofrankia californiensis TaxID=1839754 RepID=A0A1C3NSN3_9ACTN|nr:dihydrolipoyl dehydrogenase [Candidatus Protofrankia californiensis]
MPRRLLVVGGGATGVEMAQAFHRLGCPRVTIVEGAGRLLAREEPFAGEELRAAFQTAGIEVVTGVPLASARRDGNAGTVVTTLADGTRISTEEIFVAVGRRPATADLGLDTVGLASDRFVNVDGWMRVTGVGEGWLYAVGDCNGRALLTHMGKYQGRLTADVILGRDVPATTDVVSRVVFTDPQVCAVGLTEQQAQDAGLPVRGVTYGMGDLPGAQVQGTGITGTSKLVIDSERSVIVGATFVGPGVQELLHAATVAIVGQVPLDQLWHAVPSFPTVSEVWLHLLEQCGL